MRLELLNLVKRSPWYPKSSTIILAKNFVMYTQNTTNTNSPILPATPSTIIQAKQPLLVLTLSSATPTLPVKRLSPNELRKKCEKGLCYNRDQKWSTSHRCHSKYLLLMRTEE